jgi:Putative peptidoglycan binding domain
MKTKLLLLLALLSLAIADVSQADGRRWRGGGDWDGGRRWRGDWDGGRRWRGDWDGGRRWRGDWDGGRRWRGDWDGRRWRGGRGWWGGRGWYGGGFWGPYWRGGWGPAFGVGLVLPVPVFGGVYVRRPASYVTYTQPILARAQARLARLGYYPGPIDGDFGPMTSRAIRSYQLDYGLPVTGRLDDRTAASLGL